MMEHRKQLVGIAIALACSATALRAQFPTSGMILRLTGEVGVEEAPGDAAEHGDPVVRWLDQSSAGNHLTTNAIAGTQTPTYLTGVVNGRAVVNFDNGNDRLRASTPLLNGTTDFSIFAVIRPGSGGERVIGSNHAVADHALEFYVNADGKLSLFNAGGGWLVGSATLASGNWYLVHAEKSGSSATVRLNHVPDVTGVIGSSIGASLGWTIGSGVDYNAFAFGDMAEQIVYDRALTEEERNQVAHRLADNYGLSIPEPGAAVMALGALVILRWRQRP
jgi:hypothetical protein